MKKYLVLAFLVFFIAAAPARATETTTTARAPIAEPTIRVGISKANSFTFSADEPYEVYGGAVWRGEISANVTTTLSYALGHYRLVGAAVEFGTDEFLRLVPSDPTSRFTLDGYERRFEHGPVNYNQYRGTLEFRYSPKSREAYLINELPLEEYLAGIAEVPSDDPPEFIAALIVAARSYAFTHLGAAPSDHNLFDVYGSTNDQLYLGYVSELRHPSVVAAAAATRGLMITYQGAPATALYFGRSSGKTLTWGKRGGVSRPWLKSVVALYDKHRRRSGHGFGLSMHDARARASKDGWTYDQILKYYYTGVELENIY